ncbi:MAG: hypothetical protein NT059_02890 [Planctomycetota bacterium]|nr:hypothetical protein [Planctomycetota bacterium]
MTKRHQTRFKHKVAAIYTAYLCVHGLCLWFPSNAHGQIPNENPNKIVAPVLVHGSQSQVTKKDNLPKELTYLTIGPGAVIGIVLPSQTPGDSSSMLALVANTNQAAESTSKGLLVLVDGQRIPGTLDNRQGVATWVSPWCAPRTIATDELRSLSFGRSVPPQAISTDVIQLKNGDRISGLITAIAPEAVTIDVGSGADATVSIGMDTITAMSLVGPTKPHSGARVWLVDGTVIDGPLVSWSGVNYLRMTGVAGAKTPILTVPRDRVLAVQSSPQSAIPLASIVPVSSVPKGCEGMRFITRTPVAAPGTWSLDAPPLEIEGPVLLSYPALTEKHRLVAVACRSTTSRNTGVVDLVIRSAGKELLRERLDADRARVEIRVDLLAVPFDIELQPADGSAVGDMVVLERAVLFPE